MTNPQYYRGFTIAKTSSNANSFWTIFLKGNLYSAAAYSSARVCARVIDTYLTRTNQ